MLNLAGGDVTKALRKKIWEAKTGELSDRTSRLLFTCNDVSMDGVIERILELEPMVVVRQSDFGCRNDGVLCAAVRSTIDRAVSKCGIQQFIVCGHSSCSAIPRAKSHPGPDSTSGGYAGLVERMRQREIRNRLTREMVARQLSAIEKYLTYDLGLDPRQFLVQGVFYLAESGLLTIYDQAKQQFVAAAGVTPLTC